MCSKMSSFFQFSPVPPSVGWILPPLQHQPQQLFPGRHIDATSGRWRQRQQLQLYECASAGFARVCRLQTAKRRSGLSPSSLPQQRPHGHYGRCSCSGISSCCSWCEEGGSGSAWTGVSENQSIYYIFMYAFMDEYICWPVSCTVTATTVTADWQFHLLRICAIVNIVAIDRYVIVRALLLAAYSSQPLATLLILQLIISPFCGAKTPLWQCCNRLIENNILL